ncbi:bi1-like protein [Trifolium pratense]|uniref:Bi1-like protein n=1 Tax=Trifolium pratense TaxID=57577 RepID=A0A2K3LC87_TRIPR|nr:bi1-like protein [Trifolium pratense]
MYGIRDLESSSKKIDLESGTILPVNSQWPFIRKVYSIITFQLLLNIAVASVVVFDQPVANFFATTTQGLVLYIVLIFVPFLTLCSVFCCHSQHPVTSLFLALIFNITLSFPIGLTCAFIDGVDVRISDTLPICLDSGISSHQST